MVDQQLHQRHHCHRLHWSCAHRSLRLVPSETFYAAVEVVVLVVLAVLVLLLALVVLVLLVVLVVLVVLVAQAVQLDLEVLA